MASLLALFFLFLPVMLMFWLVVAQRRMRAKARAEHELPPAEPWEEVVKSEGGLVYVKRHHPNEEMADAEGRAHDAQITQILGVGL